MTDRILLQFLKNGLIELEGDDTRLQKLFATSEAVAEHLATEPSQIVPFLYTALDPETPDADIAIVKSLELLQAGILARQAQGLRTIDQVEFFLALGQCHDRCLLDAEFRQRA